MHYLKNKPAVDSDLQPVVKHHGVVEFEGFPVLHQPGAEVIDEVVVSKENDQCLDRRSHQWEVFNSWI